MQWRNRLEDDSFDNNSETFSDYFYRLNEEARRREQLEDARRREQLENDRRREQLENDRRQEQLRQQQPQVPQQSQQPQRPQQPQEDYQEMIEQPQPRIINLLDLYVFPYADDQV